MTKPAKEGLDPAKLLTETPEASDHDPDDPAADEPEGDEHEQGDAADDDDLTLDQLDARIRASIAEQLENEEFEDEPDPDAPDEKDLAARLKRAEDELAAMKKSRRKNDVLEQRVAAAREVKKVIDEFKLTEEEVGSVVNWYKKNADLEGVVPFRKAAVRVLGLGDRTTTERSGGRNGDSRRDEGAQVITRGGGGPAPKRTPFKPTPERGNYSAATAAILNGGFAAKLLKAE